MSNVVSIRRRVLAVLAWPFLFVGGNLFVWLVWPIYMLFAERIGREVSEGTAAEVVSAFSVKVLTHWQAPFTDGFRCELPQGFELRAATEARRGSRHCTFTPIDVAAFERDFLPERVVSDKKFAGVSIPLSARKIRRHLRFMDGGNGEDT